MEATHTETDATIENKNWEATSLFGSACSAGTGTSPHIRFLPTRTESTGKLAFC
jgi:hypothetical protein